MAKLDKLKKKAAEFEQKRQFDKALATYEQVLREQGTGEDADVALFNRVGDLQLRHGRSEDALRSYETAVELYAERGFLNNAIALCQKILRQDPQRAHIQFHLGRVSARKGIRGDARHHFRTYARMMERSGRVDEAVQALDAFAANASEADDALVAAAELLHRQGKSDDALTRLKRALQACESESRMSDAQAVIEQICAIDPSFEAAPQTAFAGDADIVGVEKAGRSIPGDSRGAGVSADLVLIDPAGIDYFSAAPAATPAASPSDRSGSDTPPAGAEVVIEQFGNVIAGASAANIDASPNGADVGMDLIQGADFDAASGPPASELLAGLETTGIAGESGGEELEHPLPFSMTDELLADRPIAMAEEPGPEGDEHAASRPSSAIDDALFGAGPEGPCEEENVGEIGLVEKIEISDDSIEPPAITPVEIVQPELVAPGPVSAEALIDMERGAGAFELIQPDEDVRPTGTSVEDDQPAAPLIDFETPSVEPQGQAPAPPAAEQEEEAIAVAPAGATVQVEELAVLVDEATAAAAASPPQGAQAGAPEGAPAETKPAASPDFVNLGDLLRAEDSPRSTRMVTEERAPTGDEQADFVEMLRKFKQGVAENVDHEDFDSHYDLGVAYKEMGLLDEAVAAFQRALRGPHHRVRIYEALGQCFLDKGQHAVANSVLQRALGEGGSDDQQLVGVLYLLGRASEAMNQKGEALRYYQRVFAVDIEFNDVAERIGMVEQVMQ